MNPDKNLEKFHKLVELLDTDHASTEEVAAVFQVVFKVIEDLKSHMEKEMSSHVSGMSEDMKAAHSEMYAEMERMEKEMKEMEKGCKAMSKEECRKMMEKMMTEIERVEEMIPSMPDLSELERRMAKVENREIPQIPQDLVNENRLLEEIEELKRQLEEKISKIPTRSGGFFGARGIQLYTNGTKRGIANMVNLIPGVGVSLTYDYAHGRNDITINASASTSILTATGTVNDTNTQFTFASEPVLIILNGVCYRSSGDPVTWTWNAGTSTVTLSVPVGTGGSVYGLA